MTGRASSATERALERVRLGATGYAAAKAEGLAVSTVYRAMKQARWEKWFAEHQGTYTYTVTALDADGREISATTPPVVSPLEESDPGCTPLPEPAPSAPPA